MSPDPSVGGLVFAEFFVRLIRGCDRVVFVDVKSRCRVVLVVVELMLELLRSRWSIFLAIGIETPGSGTGVVLAPFNG